MPQYRVLKKCFMDGRLYDPQGKRPTYTSDKPLKPVPPHLELITQTVAKSRAAEKKAAAATKKKVTKRKQPKKQASSPRRQTKKPSVKQTASK